MASPAPPETTTIDGRKYRQVREGLASVLAPYAANTSTSHQQKSKQNGGGQLPASARNNAEGNQAVFYNPIQQFNRDLSVLAIMVYGEGALLEKQSKFAQKVKHAKGRKDKRKLANLGVPESEDHGANGTQQPNPLKRKAVDLEDDSLDNSTTEAPAKKARADDDVEDDEDDLEVAELIAHSQNVPNSEHQGSNQDANPQSGERETDQPLTKQKQTPFSILDALSATGLRALRYAKEIPFATTIVANDLSQASVENIELNIRHNEVKDKVRSNLGDARAFMYSKVGNEHCRPTDGYVHRFDVIDIDPYGTAAPFFDCSLQALQDGGMLCITCTDAGVFASNGYPEKTFALYGGIPIKGVHSHEGGLRLILNGVAMSAARYGLAIEPLLSLYIDYYARLFIRVHRKQQDVKLLAGSTMTVWNCGHGCGSWTTQPLLRNQPQTSKSGDLFYKYSFAQLAAAGRNCEHCDSRLHLGGPMWAGSLHNPYFVQKLLEKLPTLDKKIYGTTERLEGMLTLALEEDLSLQPSTTEATGSEKPANGTLPNSRLIPRLATNQPDIAPFFIMPTYLAKIIHCATPSEDAVRGALLGLGYKVSRSHCKAGSIKTNAPWTVLWEIIREFMRTKKPIKDGAVKQGTPGWNILAKLRGTQRAEVSDLKVVMKDQVARCESKEDLKTVLQGMLYRLENDNVDKESENPPLEAETGEKTTEGAQEAGGHTRMRSSSPATTAPGKLNIVFDEKLGKEKPRGKLVRYQMNPRQFWGPMNRAGSAT